MKDDRNQLVEFIQSSGFMASIVTTGGGSGALHALLSHPGASRFVLEAQVPYCPSALAEYLGEPPAQSCSAETARQLAQTAFNHASRLAPRALGVACTAALQTNRVRKGRDRAFVCLQSADRVVTHALEIDPGERAEQEDFLSAAMLQYLAAFIDGEPCKLD